MITPLARWNEGTTRQAVLQFIPGVTEVGGPNYVPPAERIAKERNWQVVSMKADWREVFSQARYIDGGFTITAVYSVSQVSPLRL